MLFEWVLINFYFPSIEWYLLIRVATLRDSNTDFQAEYSVWWGLAWKLSLVAKNLHTPNYINSSFNYGSCVLLYTFPYLSIYHLYWFHLSYWLLMFCSFTCLLYTYQPTVLAKLSPSWRIFKTGHGCFEIQIWNHLEILSNFFPYW